MTMHHNKEPPYGGGLAEGGDEEGKMTEGEGKKMGDKSLPTINEAVEELISLYQIVWPIMITSFLLYSRSVISMLFLGHLGDAELAGGSLAIAFANITGYSVVKGLAMGMDPICGQAFGAKRWAVLSQTFQKTIILLFLSTIPIAVLWINMEPILLHLGQHPAILLSAKDYVLFSIPDLLAQSFLHPLRIFLRAQSFTTPLTFCAALALILHIPISWLLISYFNLGVKGVALASALNTVNINMGLVAYLLLSETALKPWHGASLACFQGWAPLVKLAAPSMLSVCLEWWWYEVMLLLCGLLPQPQPSVAAMGILIQTTGLIYVIPSSLSMALSTRVGNELGAGQPARARRAAGMGLLVAVVFGLAAFVFTVAVRDVWGRMFTGETRILALTTAALPIVGFCELGNCPQTVGCGILRGSARPTLGANINFSSFYLVGLPIAAVAGFRLGQGFIGLWFGLLAAQASCATLMLCVVARTDWEAQVERAEELTGGGGGGAGMDRGGGMEEDALEASLLG